MENPHRARGVSPYYDPTNSPLRLASIAAYNPDSLTICLYRHIGGTPMDESQPGGPQVRLLDLIEAMRKLRSAACSRQSVTGVVTDARGAALALLTPDGTFVSANRSAAALLGYSSAELVGKGLADLAPDDSHTDLVDELSASAAREFHSFSAVLTGRTGHPTRLALHQQWVPTKEMEASVLLTLFEEPLI